MDMRNMLIALINDCLEVTAVDNGEFIETSVNVSEIAKYLIENGVTVDNVKRVE